MLVHTRHTDSDGRVTEIFIDPAKSLDDAASSPRDSSSKESSPDTGSTNGTKPPASDAERALSDRFGWPPKQAIVLDKGNENFDDDKRIIKESRLYRWSKDHNGEGKGAWTLKG